MSRTRILLAVILALSASHAWAQAAKPAAPATAPQARPAADPAGEAFKAWDKDGNGSLSLPEFRAGWQQVQRVTDTQARLRHQFGTVDTNKNGAIDPAEYASLLLVKNAGKNAPQMSVFDGNRDGKLEFGEYVKLVQQLAPQDSGKGRAQ
ncbi:MAG: EF-hand domain-containing protein [Lysobacteraceae bacterium]|nr:MAG: EF-hand domain-containing protein [Xanthomonadaceae bacterium]